MRLSDLQKYILKQTYVAGPRCPRTVFERYYKKTSENDQDVITRSIERLIGRGLLVGYGHKTSEKFYIQKVSLTPTGRKVARELRLRDQQLPF